ncbi:MAG: phage tail tape measure protein, partial [Bacteroidota bacterium]
MNSLYELAVIFSAIDQMTGPVKKIFGGIKNYENMITKGKGMYEYGKQLGVSSALAQNASDQMIGALNSLMGPTIEIEDSLANLRTVTTSTMGNIQQSMAVARKEAVNWAKQHSDSAKIFLDASTIIAGAGLNDIQAIEGTRVALTMAKATFGEAGEAAEIMGVLYNNVADKAKDVRTEMTKLGDVVTVTQQLFQIKNMSQLAEGYKYAVPAAKMYKISIQEVSAALGMLNTTGLAGGQAGTAFNATMRQMIKASQELGFEIARTS